MMVITFFPSTHYAKAQLYSHFAGPYPCKLERIVPDYTVRSKILSNSTKTHHN